MEHLEIPNIVYITKLNTNIKIKKYTILGERHSGTNWLQNLIKSRYKLPLTWNLGFKHFFGCLDWNILNTCNDVLFICITRDVYDWIGAFKRIPYHVPLINKKNFNSFVFNEWYSVDERNNEILCDRNFINNQRYKNIFNLRKSKLDFIYCYMPYLVNNLLIIRYEDLITNHNNIMNYIGSYYNLEHKINQSNIEYLKINTANPPRVYNFTQEELELITSNIDWRSESFFGYKRR